MGIINAGTAVGCYSTGGYCKTAIVWQNGTLTELPGLGGADGNDADTIAANVFRCAI